MRRIVIGVILGSLLLGCGGAPTTTTRTVAKFYGNRPAVTVYFELSAGTVEYRWEYTGAKFTNFVVYMQDKNGQLFDMPMNEVLEDQERISGSTRVRVAEAGQYRLLIDRAQGGWEIIVRQ